MAQNRKILIVEDDLAISEMYELKLRARGHEVRAVQDGEKGLDVSKSFLPDLILLDIFLPNMNGDEMLEKLQATDWGKKMKVIVLTNVSKGEAPARLHQLRIDQYIVKAHHTPTQIADIVQDVLGKNSAA